MKTLYVHRLSFYAPTLIGVIEKTDSSVVTFTYDADYLGKVGAVPLSTSLPLQSEPYIEPAMLPYFEGLLPEGEARNSLAARLELPEGDYLSLLEACGRECIGDVLVTDAPIKAVGGSYEPVSLDDLATLFSNDFTVAALNTATRLSLAGTQTKTGLAHMPGVPWSEGWFKPQGYAATTHILKTSHLLDVPVIEFVCMKAAAACGLKVANVSLLDASKPLLVVERFDRTAAVDDKANLVVERRHQEDFAQALGVRSSSKYREQPGKSVKALADFLRKTSKTPAQDIAQLAKMLCFAYAIGDCDAHLKNYSILSEASNTRAYPVSLAPAYDLVCTTRFERFSRQMAMDFGGTRDIDEIAPENFSVLAADLGVTRKALANLVKPIVDHLPSALMAAGQGECGEVLDSTAFIAEDLLDDFAPRLRVMQAFCG